MDIKLRARLSAYSKVDSITSLQSYVPVPEATNAGNILGVGNAGEYTLIGTASPSDIDNIFTPVVDNTVTKDEIDALFPETITETDSTVNKEQIDSLFDDSDDSSTVSYAQIDSLFK